MKISCPFCASKTFIRWGARRRKCRGCERTFRGKKAGRKVRKQAVEMYLLDRSTHRRIAEKTKTSHVTSLNRLTKELGGIPAILSVTKKF